MFMNVRVIINKSIIRDFEATKKIYKNDQYWVVNEIKKKEKGRKT